MKRRRFLNASIAAVVAAVFIFSSCGLVTNEIDLDSNAVPATYSVTYMDGGTVLFTKEVPENSLAENVVLQDRYGCDFICWKLNGVKYNFTTPVTRNLVLSAHWSDVQYSVTFVADGKSVAIRTYTLKDKSVVEPDVPVKYGYTGEWAYYELAGNVTVNAVYTPIEYPVNFYDGTTLLYTTYYTLENTDIKEPDLPYKPGKTGKWSEYSLTGGDVDVHAVYDFIKYEVTFVADGTTVGICEYCEENPEITAPPVPVKEGFTGVWEDYSLNFENITVTAVYTPLTDFTDSRGLIYKKTDGEYSVTGYTGSETFIEIPERVNGLPVTTIADGAFEGCTFIKGVNLPDSLQSIGKYAFYGCTELKRAEIPDGVEEVGMMAFGGCAGLETVVIGKGVTVIEKLAFVNCNSLTSVTFLPLGDWLISDAESGGVQVYIDNDLYALTLLSRFPDKFFLKR